MADFLGLQPLLDKINTDGAAREAQMIQGLDGIASHTMIQLNAMKDTVLAFIDQEIKGKRLEIKITISLEDK